MAKASGAGGREGSEGRFVGRRADLARVRELLAANPVVTVWAPAGMGKTRLARELAREDGALFVDLSTTHGQGAMIGRIQAAMGMGASSSGGVEEGEEGIARIGHALAARRRVLLVLDNFEQLAEHAGPTLGVWSRLAPDARVLVTSRERLRLRVEASYELMPLGLAPDASQSAEQGPTAPSEAAQLFVDRAVANEPSFALDPATARAVAELVVKLEGIPLAIELAAARVGVLGVDGLLERLPQRLDVLAHGARDMDARQATLRGAIAWSWTLLSAPERAVLAEASVFRGGFTLDAAERVLVAGNATVLDVLQSLRDKSLLVSRGAVDVRFDLYESIRLFAQEKLALRADRDLVLERHGAYYLELARTSGDRRRLALEQDNVLAVVDRNRARAPARALEALVAIDPVRAARDSCAARVRALTAVLDRAAAGKVPPALLARALQARGCALRTAGEKEAAERDLDRALALARTQKDRALQSVILDDLGILHHERRSIGRARELYDKALWIHRQRGDRRAEGRTLANLGALDHDEQSLSSARTRYRQAIAIFVEVGDGRLEGIHSANLGVLEHERGDTAAAGTLYRRALELLEADGDRRLAAITLANHAALHHAEGRLEEAAAAYALARGTLRELGDRRSEGLALARLAAVEAMMGALAPAERDFDDAERLAERLGDRTMLAAVQVCRGFLDVARAGRTTGDVARAHVRAAEARIERVSKLGEDAASFALSDDARSSVRLLEQALARLEGGLAPEAVVSPDALVLGPEASFFRPPHGQWQDLRGRDAARRILAALAEQHRKARGEPLSADSLAGLGWPDEIVAPSARTNRLNVALTNLRKRGLRPHLCCREGGYLLDPALPTQRIVTLPAGLEERK